MRANALQLPGGGGGGMGAAGIDGCIRMNNELIKVVPIDLIDQQSSSYLLEHL